MRSFHALDETDPGFYRRSRGIRGDDPRMIPSDAPRVMDTTGESKIPPPSSSPTLARAGFHPDSPGFALFVIVVLLFLIHARFTAAVKTSIGTK